MAKRVFLIIVALFVSIFITTVHASSEDHLFLRIGQNTINIRWTFNVEELSDINNLFDVISLVVKNYEIIEKQNLSVSIQCFKRGNEYCIFEDTHTDDFVKTSYSTANSFLMALTEKIAKYYGLEISSSEPFNIVMLAIPIDKNEVTPDYNKFSQLYYGALPGTMQFFDGEKLFYEYFFFKEDLLISLLKGEQSFKGVLVKKQINPENIGQIGLLVY
jgi:hypothetical protein